MRAWEAAHLIEGTLERGVDEELRHQVLDYVRALFDENGKSLPWTSQAEAALHALDCNEECFACRWRTVCLADPRGRQRVNGE